MKKNLKYLGKEVSWLQKQLHDKGVKEKEVLLATLDEGGKLVIYKNGENVIPLDILE